MSFGVTTYGNGAVGILSANIVSLQQSVIGASAYTTLGINTFRYNLFEEPAKTIDNALISTNLDPANAKKTEINAEGTDTVFLSHQSYHASTAAAEGAATSLYGTEANSSSTGALSEVTTYFSVGVTTNLPGSVTAGQSVFFADGTLFGTVAWDVTLQNVGFSYTGKYAVKSWNPNVSIGTTLIAGTIRVQVPKLEYIGVGKVYNDVVAITAYPNLEPPNNDVDSPFEGRESQKLSSSNAGVGVANTFFANGLVDNTFGDFVIVSGGVPFMQDVLAFDTVSNSTGATDIANLRAELGGYRSGIGSYVGAAATVKGLKNDYAINVWSLRNDAKTNNEQIVNLQNAINILQDPTFQ